MNRRTTAEGQTKPNDDQKEHRKEDRKTAPKKKASPVKGKAKPAVKAATGRTARHTKKGEAIAMLKRGVTWKR